MYSCKESVCVYIYKYNYKYGCNRYECGYTYTNVCTMEESMQMSQNVHNW